MNYRQVGKGSILGAFDLRYHGATFKGARLMTGSNGLWVALPQLKIERDGQTEYLDIIHLTAPEREHVGRLAIADLEAQGHLAHQGRTGNPRRPAASRLTPEGEDLSEDGPTPSDDGIPF